MKIIFCNITWLKNYSGVSDGDKLGKSGGGYVGKNNDAAEAYNFQDYNGKCYGYVAYNGVCMHLERFEEVTIKDDAVDNILVIWVAKQEKTGKNVIVGWYKNATIFRYSQGYYSYGNAGRDLYFSVEAASKDCFLIPVQARKFEIPRASIAGKDKGMGQSNIWYAESGWAKTIFIPKVLEFMESYKGDFINKVYTDELIGRTLKNTSMDYESLMKKGNELMDIGDYYNALLNYNTAKEISNSVGAVFNIGMVLNSLNIFDKSIKAFENTILMEGDTEDSLDFLLNLYMYNNEFTKALNVCNRMKNIIDQSDIEVKCNIYVTEAEAYAGLENNKEAIKCLDFVINNTSDEEFKKGMLKVKSEWLLYE